MLNRLGFFCYRMISNAFHAIIWLLIYLYYFSLLDVGLVGIGVDMRVLRL